PSGIPLWTTRSSIYARGEGNFGGSRGPSEKTAVPAREADHEITIPTLPQQALLYRLCGDRNPLHADPDFATAAGFPRPILHGLCTWAMVCKAIVDTVLNGDITRVSSYSAKFAGVVFPGETLHTKVWIDDSNLIIITSTDRDTPVLSEGQLTTH
ncbi:MAG: MaoC family dehydratase, partial [Actinobacteria bacterium]|nr:MaoC family dehydratase [Actinomycetota bacterium]